MDMKWNSMGDCGLVICYDSALCRNHTKDWELHCVDNLFLCGTICISSKDNGVIVEGKSPFHFPSTREWYFWETPFEFITVYLAKSHRNFVMGPQIGLLSMGWKIPGDLGVGTWSEFGDGRDLSKVLCHRYHPSKYLFSPGELSYGDHQALSGDWQCYLQNTTMELLEITTAKIQDDSYMSKALYFLKIKIWQVSGKILTFSLLEDSLTMWKYLNVCYLDNSFFHMSLTCAWILGPGVRNEVDILPKF